MDTKTGKLYIVATPIGNLGDLSPRAVEVLRGADLIAAEDTRNTLKLLNHFQIGTPMTSYHEFNRFEKAEELVKKLLEGSSIALVSDAGTPCISDPGQVLAKRCHECGIPVSPVPGPSAAIAALSASGFASSRFVFEGFLPPKKQAKERREMLKRLENETGTIILYEAPHHLKAALEDLAETLGGGRRICLCRELTKLHEEIVICTLKEAMQTAPRGEYVLVIEGADPEKLKAEKAAAFDELSLEEHMELYLSKGMDRKKAMKQVARDRGLSKRDIYNRLEKEAD